MMVDGQYAGCILITDEVKPDSKKAISDLKHIRVESKVRGDDKVIPAMIDLCKKRTEGVEDFDYMIGHTSIPQAAELEKACRKAFGKAPLTTFNLGGVVSANTGPDTLALVYVGKARD